MELTIMDVSAGNKEVLRLVHGLFVGSFPVEERPQWNVVAGRLADGRCGYSMKAVMTDGEFVGFVTMWDIPGCVYIEHFAIDSRCRGCGIGGLVIDRVVADAGVPVVLEAEMPESGELARRRIAFYQRHGFVARDDFSYVQPSYETGEPLMPLMLMVTDAGMDMPAVARSIRETVYNAHW